MPFLPLYPSEINHAFVVNENSWMPVNKGSACRKHCWYWIIISCREKSGLCGESSFLHTFAKCLFMYFAKSSHENFVMVASWVSLPILAMNLCLYSYLIDTCQEQAAWHRRELRTSSEWVRNDSTIWNSLFLSLTSLISSKSVQFLYEQCLEPNCHGPGCNPCFFTEDSAMEHLWFPWCSEAESVCSECSRILSQLFSLPALFTWHLHMITTCTISCQMLTRPGSWEHTRLVLISIHCLYNFLSDLSLMNLSLSWLYDLLSSTLLPPLFLSFPQTTI